MAEITQAQFEALARLLRASESSARYRIARLVLVDGMDVGDAARAVGSTYNAAHQAVAGYRDGLALAKAAAGVA